MSRPLLLLCLSLSALTGCGSSHGEQSAVKQPRPVTVFTLQTTDPQAYDRLSGSVTSWKTEDIGFEVDGRVQFVIEPETDVTGRELQQNGTSSATLLASLDEERYQLRVKSAAAQVLTAERQRDATGIEIESVIPAQLRAAQAEVTRAGNEFERVRQFFKKDVRTK